jgi:hypothetical protein
VRARRQQLDCFLDQRRGRERAGLEVELSGFDLGEIEDFLDQRKERTARCLDRLGVGRLLGRERSVEHQPGHAEDAVERRADFVRDHGEEARLRPVGAFRLVACVGERALGLRPVGHVAADALRFRAFRGDPARAFRCGDFLIVNPGAVREYRRPAVLDDFDRE